MAAARKSRPRPQVIEHREKRRDPYKEVGPAARQAIRVAGAAKVTPKARDALDGVLALTALYSLKSAIASTGQIAVAAGLWKGEAKTCPSWIRDKMGRGLQELHAVGAVVYEPGGKHGWMSSRISLPAPTETEGAEPIPAPTETEGAAPPVSTGQPPRNPKDSPPGDRGSLEDLPEDPPEGDPSDLLQRVPRAPTPGSPRRQYVRDHLTAARTADGDEYPLDDDEFAEIMDQGDPQSDLACELLGAAVLAPFTGPQARRALQAAGQLLADADRVGRKIDYRALGHFLYDQVPPREARPDRLPPIDDLAREALQQCTGTQRYRQPQSEPEAQPEPSSALDGTVAETWTVARELFERNDGIDDDGTLRMATIAERRQIDVGNVRKHIAVGAPHHPQFERVRGGIRRRATGESA